MSMTSLKTSSVVACIASLCAIGIAAPGHTARADRMAQHDEGSEHPKKSHCQGAECDHEKEKKEQQESPEPEQEYPQYQAR